MSQCRGSMCCVWHVFMWPHIYVGMYQHFECTFEIHSLQYKFIKGKLKIFGVQKAGAGLNDKMIYRNILKKKV